MTESIRRVKLTCNKCGLEMIQYPNLVLPMQVVPHVCKGEIKIEVSDKHLPPTCPENCIGSKNTNGACKIVGGPRASCAKELFESEVIP